MTKDGCHWLRLTDDPCVRVELGEGGIIESAAFPGLGLHIVRLLAGDYTGAVVVRPNVLAP